MPERAYCPEGAEYTYQYIYDSATQLAQSYSQSNYGHGHRVGLLLENRPEFFFHYLALNSIGTSIVPINPDYRHDELVYLIGHCDAQLIITISNRVEDMEKAAAECVRKPPVIDESNFSVPLPQAKEAAPRLKEQPGRETECAMLYTSGTTGRPKGCVLTNEYFITSGEWYLSLGGQATMDQLGERVLNPLPLYHMNSLAVTATAMMCSGGCLISPDRFHPKTWWSDVVSTKATVIHYLGVIPPLLLNLPTSVEESEHVVKFGIGAGIDPQHHAVFEERFGIPMIEVWGMTETGRILGDIDDPRQVGKRAIGRPMKGLEVRVVNEEDHDVPIGEPGELLIRFSGSDPRMGFFSGYYKNEQATREAWQGGWFHTGDTVSRDESGMLYFIDRNKNIIRRSGENISAGEVEAVLQSNEGVAQAAVIGVKDDLREEEVYACVVLMSGQDSDEAAAKGLFNWCMERLAYFKVPGYFLFREKLPTTGTQKVQKTQIFLSDIDPRSLPECIDFRDFKLRKL